MAKITIFGLAGTGTSSVGKLLAEKLGYTFISTGMLFRAKAASLGMDLYQFEALCNSDPEYDKAIDMDMKNYGEENENFVAESRLAWHFIPDSYKIKLICDTDVRLKRVAGRDNVSLREAQEKTLFREQSHLTRFAEYYGIKNFGADSIFDFILNTTNISLNEVVDKLKDAVDNIK